MTEEIWRDIDGYDGKYQVSNFGRVKSFKYCREGRILKPSLKRGYPFVQFGNRGKQVCIHRLVAKAFIPNPDNKPEVNHIDGNPLNNHIDNLEWCTASENTRHAVAHGLRHSPKGTAHHAAKFTDEQIAQIRSECILGDLKHGISALARKYNASSATISYIVHGKSYGTCDKPKRAFMTNAKLNEEQRKFIREVYTPRHAEFGAKALAERFGVCDRTINDIVHKK